MVVVTLKNILQALLSLGVDGENIEKAIAELTALLAKLDEVEVKGRQNVDTLLGCMMALEAIIGEQKNVE